MSKRLLIDLGGTKIKFGLLDGETLSNKTDIDTEPKSGFENISNNILNHIKSTYADFESIAISQAGVIAKDYSVFYANDNLPGFTGKSLAATLETKLNVPTAAFNDVVATGGYIKHAMNITNAVVITPGTGVGVAVIDKEKNKDILGLAGQIGNLKIEGTNLDKYLSFANLADQVKSIEGDIDFSQSSFETWTEAARDVVESYAKRMSQWIHNLVFMYGKVNFWLGGNIKLLGDSFIKLIKEQLKVMLPETINNLIEIQFIEIGNDANLLGAHYLMGETNEK